ncbi:hypothetical protein [Arthrobacter sp. MAHUQ-56]
METEPTPALYSGSIDFLQGGAVLWARPCSCPRCHYTAGPRRIFGRYAAAVMCPWTGVTETIEHARAASLGRVS